MGRPLAKRFFGNRNVGTTGTADDGIGGEGVASVVLNALGNYTTRATVTFAVPTLPGGVRATGTITSEASTVAPDGTLLAGSGYAVDDLITFAGITGVVGRVAVVGIGQQEIQSIDFVGAGTDRGSFEALSGLTKTGLAVTVIGKVGGGSGSAGTGQTAAITFRAKAVVITEKGSGYTAAPTPTFSQSVTATSVTLTTDSGDVSSTTNQENAITAYAYVTGNSLIADINAQKGSRRYRVTTSEGTEVCKLVAATPAAVGEMSITATDSSGKTYYVTKLLSHKALLTQYGTAGHEFDDGAMVQWTFDAATLNTTVQIANA